MAQQIKLFLILIIFSVGAYPAPGTTGGTCGKAWVQMPYGAYLQDGRIFEVRSGYSDQADKVEIKDFKGNFLKEYKLPRKTDATFPFDQAGEGVLYRSDGKWFHFDPLKQAEQEIKLNLDKDVCQSSGSPILISCSSTENGKKSAYDPVSQRNIELSNNLETRVYKQTVVSSEGPKGSSTFSTISILDFSTGKKVSFDVPSSQRIDMPSDHFIKVTPSVEKSRPINFVRVGDRWVQYMDTRNSALSGILPNGDLLFTHTRHKSGKDVEPTEGNIKDFELTTEIFDNSGTQKKSTLSGYYMIDNRFGKNPIKIEFPPKFSIFSEEDFKKLTLGKDVKPLIVTHSFPMASQSGRWVLANDSTHDETKIIDLKTGRFFKLPYMQGGFLKEGEDGINIEVVGGSGSTYVVNTRNGNIRSFSGRTIFDKNLVDWIQNHDGVNEALQEVCFPNTVKVIEDDCNCMIKVSDKDFFVGNDNIHSLKDIALASMCQNDYFDSFAWDKITPEIASGEISHQQAVLYLKRFQKGPGYDPQRHLPILMAILKSDMVEKSPALVNETLKILSVYHPSVLRSIYNVLKIDKKLPVHYQATPEDICRAPVEQGMIDRKLTRLKEITANSFLTTTTESWLEYKPFKEEFQKLPKSERDAIVDAISESLSQSAAVSADLDGTFQSKLYYFSKKYALGLVGDDYKPASDLAIAVRDGKNIPIILASGEVSKGQRTPMEDVADSESPFGFSYGVLPPIAIPAGSKIGDKFQNKIDWIFNETPLSANVKVTVQEPLGSLIPQDKTPNYEALKRDKKLTGLMIVGSNLGGDDARVGDEYLTYYQNAGFEFKEPKSIDAISFFKDKIRSGELDYLIKEAHSDGDERNLLRAYKSGKLLEGNLKKENDLTETIYLLVPDENTHKGTALISNQEFGSWIRSREGKQPLVYFNSSCSSVRKAISEIAAVHSDNFIPIPSVSSTSFFYNSHNSSLHEMIRSFRDEGSFESIRQALQRTTDYQGGRDRYIFPDEPAYDEVVRNNLKMNLDVEVSVKDKSGKEIYIDENIGH